MESFRVEKICTDCHDAHLQAYTAGLGEAGLVDVEVVEVLLPDINGQMRGKWVGRDGLGKVFTGGYKLRTLLAPLLGIAPAYLMLLPLHLQAREQQQYWHRFPRNQQFRQYREVAHRSLPGHRHQCQ